MARQLILGSAVFCDLSIRQQRITMMLTFFFSMACLSRMYHRVARNEVNYFLLLCADGKLVSVTAHGPEVELLGEVDVVVLHVVGRNGVAPHQSVRLNPRHGVQGSGRSVH